MICKIDVGTADDEQKRDNGEQVDLPGVVTARADFPAHGCVLPKGTLHVNANRKQSFPSRHAPAILEALQQSFARKTGALLIELVQSFREGALTPRQRP